MDDATDRPTRWLTDPLESGAAAGFGVYLHVPFCAHRCGYCDFATWELDAPAPGGGTFADLVGRVADGLVADLRRTVAAGPRALAPDDADVGDAWPTVTSVSVGGGTPSKLGAAALARAIATVGEELDLAGDAEVTVEVNPEDVTPELVDALAGAGVTRLSMGAQSFAPHVLTTLERGHGPERIVEAAEVGRAGGVPDLSLDLIYGTPGETEADWRTSLASAVAAGADHLSAYALTIHDNTPFGRAVATGAMPAPDEDVQRDRFDLADEVLAHAGFHHYEVSNWARGVERRSRHNLLYWRHGDYLGVGVGAHGHLAGRRWWGHRSIPRWLAAVEAGEPGVGGSEVLTVDERATERLLLGLRVREGLHPADVPPLDPLALEDALDAGLVTTACGRLQATADGWFLLDEAVARLAP
ncbi:MAG: radical SAM family heme chaperone HemW [Actinomycetes bacterium]